MLLRIVKMSYADEHCQEFEELFSEINGLIAAQPGCHSVKLLKAYDNPGVYFTISEWDDEDSLNAYRNTELFGAVWPKVKKWMKDKPVAYSNEILASNG